MQSMERAAINRAEAGGPFPPEHRGVEQFYFSLLEVFGSVAEALTLLSY